MKIYSCESHIDQAIDVFIARAGKISDHGESTGKRKVIHKLFLL